MKVIVLTDIHANLPALKAALKEIGREGYDLLFHLGDTIDIGPFPGECLDLILNQKNSRFVMGNHDKWFAEGLPSVKPKWMSEGELEHINWTLARLDPQLQPIVAGWPYQITEEFEGVKTSFFHYGLDASKRSWLPIIRKPQLEDLDELFSFPTASELIFYGHHHPFSDLSGRARYINPGALGCHSSALARFTVVEYSDLNYSVTQRSVPYDNAPLVQAFKRRNVPDRTLVNQAFFADDSLCSPCT